MSEAILVKKHLPSGTIVLNRPERCNALTRAMVGGLRQALADLHQERRVRAVILTGAGRAFCGGLDLREMHADRGGEEAQRQWQEDAWDYRELLLDFLRYPKPLIASVNGAAVGAGAGLVLACDLNVAGEHARFGFPEPRRGLAAGLSAPLLAFRAGGGAAARLLLAGEFISPAEALRLGVYHELAATDLLWARAHQIAETVARGAPESLQLTKRLLNETIGETVQTWLSSGAAASAAARTTDAAAEGLSAFVEKREPKWP